MLISDTLPPTVDQQFLHKLPVKCDLHVPEAHDRPHEQSAWVKYREGVTAGNHTWESQVLLVPWCPSRVQAESLRVCEGHNTRQQTAMLQVCVFTKLHFIINLGCLPSIDKSAH